MNYLNYLFILFLPLFYSGLELKQDKPSQSLVPIKQKSVESIYKVVKLNKPIKIDANWNKAQWKKIETIKIEKDMGKIPPFKPVVEAKMMYDDDNVYVIFRVQDRFVKSVVEEYNGNVSGDSCVEFFFSPDTNLPLKYFNLEINAGGTPLIFYVEKPWTGFVKLKTEEIKQIEIAHSLPSKVDPEIKEPVTWTIEYRVPLSMLRAYSKVSSPASGVIWKANFYKTGSLTSNPNWITWSFVDKPRQDFHTPEYFGTLIFQ